MSARPSDGPTPPPRSARTRQAVLAAAAALLEEGGLPAATIDAIRDRSGVSKTTIYKYWPNRLCVAIDAFTDRLADHTDIPNSGTAREDIALQLRRVADFYTSPIGKTFAQLIVGAAHDPIANDYLGERLTASRSGGIHLLWDRAVARGEMRDDVEPDIALDLLFGPTMWRLMTSHRTLTHADIEKLTNAALTGLLNQAMDQRATPG